MILKNIDPIDKDIQTLNKLYELAETNQIKSAIKCDIDKISKGYQGEEESAYYINEHLSESKNWIVLHDLKLKLNGRKTQIDHLLINRLGIIYVIETKNWESKIIINKYGEFTIESNGNKYGVESPLEQNRRHIKFLEWYIDKKNIWPNQLGIRLKPEYINMVLLHKKARIKRTMRTEFDTSNIIKVDSFASKFDSFTENVSLLDTWRVLKLISQKNLIEVGEKLIYGHIPRRNDYNHKYNIKSLKKNRYCASCKISISVQEANYCWSPQNKKRFENRTYCRECQKKFKSIIDK